MGSLNLPLYVWLPFLLAAAFLLWVLLKFWEEEHHHGARSRNPERSRVLKISEPGSSFSRDSAFHLRRGTADSLGTQERPDSSRAA